MDSMIFGIVMGVWFIAAGVYSFYYAFMMKQTGTIKTGWILSRDIQLKESRDLPGFIEEAGRKTKIFAIVATTGGFLFLIGVILNQGVLMAICLIALIVAFVWYSSAVRNAEKKYLTPTLKKKVSKKKVNKKK